jgi:hypothetical protein
MDIEEWYQVRCNTPHNINRHLPLLRQYAARCRSIVEFGTDVGFSTTAFLAAQPERLDSYDLRRDDFVGVLAQVRGRTEFVFHEGNTLTADVPECDLLFIDTEHTYDQLRRELALHGNKARKYLAFHDTVSCPEIVPAIVEFVRENAWWALWEWRTDQNGLAVFKRLRG